MKVSLFMRISKKKMHQGASRKDDPLRGPTSSSCGRLRPSTETPPQHLTYHMSCVMWHMSCVTRHVSHVTCHISMSHILDFFWSKFFNGGSVISRAYPCLIIYRMCGQGFFALCAGKRFFIPFLPIWSNFLCLVVPLVILSRKFFLL